MWISWIFEAPEVAVIQSILHLCKAGHEVYFEKVKDTQVLKQIHINNLHRDTNTNMNAMPALDFLGDICAEYNTFCSIAVLCALILKGEKNQTIGSDWLNFCEALKNNPNAATQRRTCIHIYSLCRYQI